MVDGLICRNDSFFPQIDAAVIVVNKRYWFPDISCSVQRFSANVKQRTSCGFNNSRRSMVGIVRICEDKFDIRHKKRGTRCYSFHSLGLSHLPFTVKRATLNPTPYVNTPIADCEKRSLTTWCIYTHREDIHRCLFPTVIEICEISVSRTQTLVNV